MSDIHMITDSMINSLKGLMVKCEIEAIRVCLVGAEEDILFEKWNSVEISRKDKTFLSKGDKVRFKDGDFNWSYGLVYSVINKEIECISLGEGVCQTPQVVELFNWNEEFLIKELLK